MQISEFQSHIENVYGEKDRERGIAMSVAWLQKRLETCSGQLEKELMINEFMNLGMSSHGYSH